MRRSRHWQSTTSSGFQQRTEPAANSRRHRSRFYCLCDLRSVPHRGGVAGGLLRRLACRAAAGGSGRGQLAEIVAIERKPNAQAKMDGFHATHLVLRSVTADPAADIKVRHVALALHRERKYRLENRERQVEPLRNLTGNTSARCPLNRYFQEQFACETHHLVPPRIVLQRHFVVACEFPTVVLLHEPKFCSPARRRWRISSTTSPRGRSGW